MHVETVVVDLVFGIGGYAFMLLLGFGFIGAIYAGIAGIFGEAADGVFGLLFIAVLITLAFLS